MSPALTETFFYLKIEHNLTAISQFCLDHGKKLPRVGTPFTPAYEKIVKLKPRKILSQPIQGSKFYNFTKKLNLTVEQYPFNSLEEIEGSIVEIAKKFKSPKGEIFKKEVENKKKVLRSKNRKGTFYAVIDIKGGIEQFKGLVLAGKDSYFSQTLELTGLKNVAPFEKGYKDISIETLLKNRPENIVIFNRSKSITVDRVSKYLTEKLRIKKAPRVLVFDKEYTVIPGPSILKLMEDINSAF